MANSLHRGVPNPDRQGTKSLASLCYESPDREGCAVVSMNCPSCDSQQIHRSRRKELLESSLFTLLFIRPFRCTLCDHRFFSGPSLLIQELDLHQPGYDLV